MNFSVTHHSLDSLQKVSVSLMAVLVLLTFVGANLHAVLWQSSEWLVSTVLPATVVDLTNKERSHTSLQPLQRNAVLDEAARLKAKDMANNEYFAHFSPDGVSPWHWFAEAGYVYAYAGENLAIHFTDSAEVVEAWMNSPTHKENIVNNRYTEIGVGTAKGRYQGYDTVYVVQLFGTPAAASKPTPVPPPIPAPKSTPAVVPPAAVISAPPVVVVAEPEVVASTSVKQAALTELDSQAAELPETDTEQVLAALSDESEVTPAPDQTTKHVRVAQSSSTEESERRGDVLETTITQEEPAKQTPADVVVLQMSPISTSSGLAVARITTPNDRAHAGATISALATQPNELLQIVYVLLAICVVALLSTSTIMEARRMRYVQVAYSVALLLLMGGLWFVHSLLTVGAVIV